MNPQVKEKATKNTTKEKRKKDANISIYSDNGTHNKVSVLCTSKSDGNSNDCIFTEVTRDLRASCFSTPINESNTCHEL